ncbi:fringe glycosyltransferase-like isoform X1 [Centruroides sculpturatus]|uniref:fringe glycosyltransferase-like isoform X1 n=1 Tax=Centruroides sculpturatus TaxID=218467 RepID=UPI000C6EF031|nr:fringe glycosyltransferase-like isoform X1 [Centruroides sculpturatus]
MRCCFKKIARLVTCVILILLYLFLITLRDHRRNAQDGGSSHNVSVFTEEEEEEEIIFNNLIPRDTELRDLFVSVKTTKIFHQNRLEILLKTWFTLAREQTYFFTDTDDPVYQAKTNGHMINTNCSSSHNRKALCCKMAVELDTFVESDKKWFCHFDDDNYVNVPRLVNLLKSYQPQDDWYLGKPSIHSPLQMTTRDNVKLSFWFATGGAGFCLSRALVLKMMPFTSDGKFISVGERIRLPDDVSLGYVIEHLLKKRLTVVEQFHSHLEPMKFIKPEEYKDQITFSYSRLGQEMNVLPISGFDNRVDPTRFLSLHCYLFPEVKFCSR